MQDMECRNAFIPPTALRMLRAVKKPRGNYSLKLRTIASGGEALGRETLEWGREKLGPHHQRILRPDRVQSRARLVGRDRRGRNPARSARPCRATKSRSSTMAGEPVPPVSRGRSRSSGRIPVMFLGYWQNEPEATEEKFIGDWMTTGDQGVMDEEGYVPSSAATTTSSPRPATASARARSRIACSGHPAVAARAAVGKPDPRSARKSVKAYVVLQPGFAPSDAMASEISNWVRTRLSAHEYPRGVAFVDSLPLTTTGKVIRRELRERAAQEARAEASR
jgi:acetyl-CoA synthetase